MALCLSVWIIECRSVFLSAFVVQSIQQPSPGELIRISRISLPANSDVTASLLPSVVLVRWTDAKIWHH